MQGSGDGRIGRERRFGRSGGSLVSIDIGLF